MHCPQCATELPDDARFCGACGTNIEQHAASEGPAPAPEEAEAGPEHSDGSSAFTLTPEDFGRALVKACEKAELPLPADPLPTDHLTLKAAGEALGLSKLAVEQALHRVSMEKLPPEERRALGVVLDDEVEPAGRSSWVPVVVGVNLVAIAIAVVAFLARDTTSRPEIVLPPQQGQLDVAALNEALEPVTEAAQACYRDALKSDAKLAGEVVLTLRVGLDGKAAVTTRSASLASESALGCIRAAAESASYPAATIAPVEVDVPFSFSASTTD